MPICPTPTLDIAYEQGRPTSGSPVLLLHGWPAAVRGWDGGAPLLERAGYRWIAPYLRGFGGTRFRDAAHPRDGSASRWPRTPSTSPMRSVWIVSR